jgi:Fe-S-cluster containining protein
VAATGGPGPTTATLDVELLAGFRYACRPDCGLCCFTEPRLDAGDRVELLQIQPEVELVEGPDGSHLQARSDGGACQFLDRHRCGIHPQRPYPCREFPVTVHVGIRPQATVVLSCPGVAVEGLLERARGARAAPSGFDDELASVVARLTRTPAREVEQAARNRRKLVRDLDAAGRWRDEAEVRAALHGSLPLPGPEDFPAEDPPSADEGLEFLPLYFDGRAGPVAIATGLGGWELLELAEGGGVAARLGVIPPPAVPPALDDRATDLLRAYVDYHVERDAFLASVALEMAEDDEGDLLDWAAASLRLLGATVVARALVRAKSRRDVTGPLRLDDIAAGIRATDQDVLDRPTWGYRL